MTITYGRARRYFQSLLAGLRSQFTWSNTRWLLAELLSQTIVTVGALTSATGGFKAIPVLLSLYPFNLFVLPVFLVSFLCWAAALSGALAFYSCYSESMLKACYNLIDWLKAKITSSESSTSNSTPTEALEKSKQDKIIDLKALIQSTKTFCDRLYNPSIPPATSKFLLSRCSTYLSAEKLTEYQRELGGIYNKFHEKNFPETPVKPNRTAEKKRVRKKHFLEKIKNLGKIFIQILSLALVILGCAVVIGMGVLTIQGFLSYYGMTPSGMMTLGSFISAISKQICQMALGVVRQHQIFCSIFGVGQSIKDKLTTEIENLSQNISAYEELRKRLHEIEEELLQAEEAGIASKLSQAVVKEAIQFTPHHQTSERKPKDHQIKPKIKHRALNIIRAFRSQQPIKHRHV